MSYQVLYRDGRHEPREWVAVYETKAEALRQAAFDLELGEVVEVQDANGKRVLGKTEIRAHAKECQDKVAEIQQTIRDSGLKAFVERVSINRKV